VALAGSYVDSWDKGFFFFFEVCMLRDFLIEAFKLTVVITMFNVVLIF
jgi:hypothetical protein